MTACFQISRLSIKTNFLSSDKVRHPDHRLVYRWIDVNVYRIYGLPLRCKRVFASGFRIGSDRRRKSLIPKAVARTPFD
jgi:hypothetical protein